MKKVHCFFVLLLVVFCFSVLTVSAQPAPAESLTTNLTNLTIIDGKGNWSAAEKGIRGDGLNMGDCFVMSDVKVEEETAFRFSADVTVTEGVAVGIVFGVTDPADPAAEWMCVNLDAGNEIPLCRLFGVKAGQLEFTVNMPFTAYRAGETFNLSVEVDEDNHMEFFVNGELIGTTDEALHSAGYFGIMVANSNSVFDNLNYEELVQTPTPTEEVTSTPTNEATPIPTEEAATSTKGSDPVTNPATPTATTNPPMGDAAGIFVIILICLCAVLVYAAVIRRRLVK